MRKLQSQGVHHITLVGADRQTSIDFWEGVLGMPFVFEQPNLDQAGHWVSHEMVRVWWQRFGPMFAAKIRRKRVSQMRTPRWRWHLNEVFVGNNSVQHHLWHHVGHKGDLQA